MINKFSEFSTGALLNVSDKTLLEDYRNSKLLEFFTFIWVKEGLAEFIVDSIPVMLSEGQIIALTTAQHFQFLHGDDLVVYQFNREFYCIKDHDKEVSCNGLLFFGDHSTPIITLDPIESEKFDMLHKIFLDELQTKDTIQAEMLRMLMARFIIKTTRIFKAHKGVTDSEKQTNLFRSFNQLVETHFRKEHSVSFYAEQLYKSPKTLSNRFSRYGKSPLQIIHDRIVLEAKRLLYYTDKTAKEVAYELGFDDASHLSRLFKKQTGFSPSSFRQQKTKETSIL